MIQVNDCRFEKTARKTLKTSGLDFNGFVQVVQKTFSVLSNETFVLTTTDRIIVDADKFDKLKDGTTLYLLRKPNQVLPASIEEEINFIPHYNTLIESGTDEYFIEGQKSLPSALAQLVDNALSATAKNTGVRSIEIRMLFDKTCGKSAVVVLDNGCGMTSKQLNNWAIYRLSKFTRENSTSESEREGYTRPEPVRCSLNSNISYFGVGGKQAAFHIGNSVRMITKPRNSPDVHELVLSKDEFEKKEKNKEDVYKGTILNRKPGDFSHITHEERYLQDIIKEETRKESFTAVVITGVCPDHIKYLKDDFHEWTRQLAHIYHYYIHGVDGNHKMDQSQKSDASPKIDILVTLREKPPAGLRQKNLREVQDDLQTLYINSAVDTFEFKATTSDGGSLEGILRYHPFLYDKETYPKDPSALQASVDEDDDENQSGTMNRARGKRDIFECFWNGRLIPYTTISEFDWCRWPNKSTLPLECFSRFSGVLFTNDKFRVNASKQKFMDLELKLRHRDTHFTPVFNVQKASKNRNIQKEFMQWLEKCHSQFDKQVKFLGYSKTVTRTDVPTKKLQHPWAVFSAIELDGKTYKAGDLVKSQRTQPIYYGKVNTFFLYGDHKGNVFATGGEVEITRVPEALYDNYTRTIPISKIDRSATIESIKRNIETDIDKLPEKLCVTWPEGNALPQNAVISAGTPLGPLAVEILNRNNKSISSRIQTGVQGGGIKLNVGLKIFFHGAKEVKQPKQICHFRAPYIPGHGHRFKKIGSLTNLGKYTLTLQAEVSDNANNRGITSYGGRQLPSYEHKFTVKEGNAEIFTIGPLNPSLCIGVPFSIPMQMTDFYGHPTKPPPNLQPVLECSDLEVSFETTATSGNSFTIKGVKVIGEVQNYQQTKSFDLKVTLPGLKKQTQTIEISPFPVSGNPHSLVVKPEVKPVKVENGNPVSFNVEVHDEAGNITANAKQIVRCQIPGLKLAVTDCSSSGTGQIVTEPINLKIINGEPQMLQAKFDMPSQKHVVAVTTELKVMPSCRVSRMELFCEGEERLELKNKEKIQWQAGGVLENLLFKLYDESGKEVEVTPEIASNIKVNWTGDIDQTSLIRGRLPDVQVPTKVQKERFHQVSYRDQNVSFSFTIVPCPDEPARLKATVVGKAFTGSIKNVLDVKKEETEVLEESRIPVSQSSSIQIINSLLQEKTAEKEKIERTPRRVFPLSNHSGPDILGMVGHLAHISDDNAAWVISWHLAGNMDCIITKTTAEAQKIFHSERGRQQVMALDNIYVNPGNSPLPHIKNGRELFSPVGNPLYARNLLIYTTEEESCERVFKNILGNTILMDDIESATNYRKAVIEKGNYCPTILTLDGNRLGASGNLGGAQNKAPHKDMVKKFGAPLPQRYYELQKEIELLIQYRSALEKKKDAEDERKNTILKLSEIQQEMEETKAELQEIERRLGKRGPEDISEPSGLMIKRPR